MALQKAISDELTEQLISTTQSAYSISGYKANKSVWCFTLDDIKKIILNITKDYVKDVSDCTLEINHKTGAIYAYVWIPKNSPNVCDNSLQNNDSAVRKSLTKFSADLKTYMDKFVDKNRRRLVPEGSGLQLVGIEVKIENFMKIELDENGVSYGDKFGSKYSRKAKINLKCNFEKGDDGRFGKLIYLEATKSFRSSYNGNKPRPRQSYNAR